MVKGLGAGMLSGGVVAAIVMSGLSLYAPLPQDRIDAAPKLQATQAEPDTAAPATSSTAAETAAPTAPAQADDAPVVAPSDADTPAAEAVTDDSASVAPEAADTSAQPVEATEQAAVVSNEATVQTAQTEDSATPVATAATANNAQSVTIAAEDTSVAAEAETTPSVVAEVDTAQAAPTEDTAASLEGDAASTRVQPAGLSAERIVGEEQVEESGEPTQTAALAAPKPALPRITTPKPATSPEPVSADTPVILPTPSVPGVVTNRLPKVGGATAAEDAPAVAEETPTPADDLGALEKFASAVEGADGKSLMAFVLIDTGEDGLPRADLASLAIPVTIAIDPVMENAAQIMAEYRAAGVEVVAIANDLPVASGPGDVATAVSAYFDVLSQSVALMDPLDARIQSNRSLLQPVLGAIRDTGHGLITYDRGLNTAQQAAQRESIPAATVYRVLDADLEETPKIKRYLDRAAFAANQDGSVVLVGRSYKETVQALVEWSLEKKDASIAIVPVSTVMLGNGS